MMSGVIRQETAVFLILTLHGAAMGLLYDLLRALRRSFPHGLFLVSAEDFLYWAAAAFQTFCLIFSGTEGQIRGYMAAGMALGALLYRLTLSPLIVRSVSYLLLLTLRIVRRTCHFLKHAVLGFVHLTGRAAKRLARRVVCPVRHLAHRSVYVIRRLAHLAGRPVRHLVHLADHRIRHLTHFAGCLIRYPANLFSHYIPQILRTIKLWFPVLSRPANSVGGICQRSAKTARKKEKNHKKRIEFRRKRDYNEKRRAKRNGVKKPVRGTQYGRKQETFKQ